MKILIDIDRETYKDFTSKDEYILSDSVTRMAEAVQNGVIVEENSLTDKMTLNDLLCETKCGWWDREIGCCTCPPMDSWYQCPIEVRKPENQKALKYLYDLY